MKIPRIANAISNIDDELLVNAEASGDKKRGVSLIKLGALAACFVLMFTAALLILPRLIDSGELPIDTDIHGQDTEPTTEIGFSENYVYRVNEPVYSKYIGGKVIEEEKLGEKIGAVTVTAGWERGDEKLSEERLRADVYLITGVSREAAVALRFLDKGDALTLTHYYVILNPEADLSELQEYVIGARVPTEGEYGEETTPEDIIEGVTEPRAE